MQMKRYYLILILSLFISCSSAQIIKSANNDIAKIESNRTRTLIEIIDESSMTSLEKRLLKESLKTKDDIILALNKTIEAYNIETNKAIDKTDKAIVKNEKCERAAGFGDAWKWILIVAGGLGLIYLRYQILTKTSLLSLIGIKKP